ncbi:hypothetical protein [Gordonia phthalatica]|nr:hypothetical protein [Gordonia phthalatica]
MRTQQSPQTMVTMFGLNRLSFRIALTMVIVVYVIVGVILPHLGEDSGHEMVATIGAVGLAVSLWLAARGDDDPIGLGATVAAVLLGGVSAGAIWWSIPAGPMNWIRPSAPFVAYTIAMALLAIRGRIAWAWCGFILVSATAATAGIVWGWGGGTAAQAAVRMLVSLVPVTLVMLFVRPLLLFARVLDRREVVAVAEEAAQAATAQQRRRQAAALDGEVRPILEKIAAGEEISPTEAVRARLLEHDLRDSVRGAGWMSPAVREAVAQARQRGVEVRLFDDRPGGSSTIDCEVLRGELLTALRAADRGAVTARMLPRGRDAIAVIVTQDGDDVRRRYCRAGEAGRPEWNRDPDGGAV